jgi:glycosyltransferase involved in cell wall biosynthesis
MKEIQKPETIGLLMGIYNEAQRIVGCLDYHLPFVDEAMIVIQESDDGTEKIVDEYIVKNNLSEKVKVMHFPKMGCSEATLQDGVNEMKSDWVLYVDADEVFPLSHLKEMHELILTDKHDAFRFERDNFFDVPVFAESVPIVPKVLRIQHPSRDPQVRLTRKSLSVFPRQIHVRARVRRPNGEEFIRTLDNPIVHIKSFEEQWIDNSSYLPQTKIVDAMEVTKREELIDIPRVKNLLFAEIDKQIPFDIKRVFYIFAEQGEERGNHANRQVHELLICLQGSAKVELDNGVRKMNFVLNDPSKGLFIKSMTWVKFGEFEKGTILLCLASKLYNEIDYIREYQQFKKEVNK